MCQYIKSPNGIYFFYLIFTLNRLRALSFFLFFFSSSSYEFVRVGCERVVSCYYQ